MRHSFKKFVQISLGTMLLFISSIVHARDAEIAQRQRDLAQLRHAFDNYKLAFERHIEGENGILLKIDAYQKMSGTWTADWEALNPLVTRLKTSFDAGVERDIFSMLLKQGSALRELESLQKSINPTLELLVFRLPNNEQLPLASQALGDEAKLLGDASKDLLQLSRDLVTDGAALLARQIKFNTSVYELMVKALKLAKVSGAQHLLDEVIDAFESLMRSETVAEPLVTEVNLLYRELVDDTLGLWVFRSAEQLDKIRVKCTENKQKLTNLSGIDTYKAELLAALENKCSQAEQRYTNLIAGYSKGVLLASAQPKRIQKLKARCEKPQPDMNCANFDWLSKLNPEVIKGFSEEQLKVLESSWDNLAKGVL